LFSGGFYLPAELYELVKGFSWITIVFVLVNFIVVMFMAAILAKKGTGTTITDVMQFAEMHLFF
jgi:uncharacterized membrane protein (DUF2068 family)